MKLVELPFVVLPHVPTGQSRVHNFYAKGQYAWFFQRSASKIFHSAELSPLHSTHTTVTASLHIACEQFSTHLLFHFHAVVIVRQTPYGYFIQVAHRQKAERKKTKVKYISASLRILFGVSSPSPHQTLTVKMKVSTDTTVEIIFDASNIQNSFPCK